jgi:hypothetical protein
MIKKHTVFLPLLPKPQRDFVGVLKSCHKRVPVFLGCVAEYARRYTVTLGSSASFADGNEMIEYGILPAAISATPVEIIQGIKPFFQCETSGKSAVCRPQNLLYNPVPFSGILLVFTAIVAQFIVSAALMSKECITTNRTNLSVFRQHLFGTRWMIKAYQQARNIIETKLNHAFHGSRVMAVFAPLLTPIPRYINEPFMYFHVPPKRKSPFASRCSATQRGRFDCISDLLATPSNSVNRDYTMRLERMCL